MDPLTVGLISGGIAGGASLLSGLMGAKAKREAEQQQRMMEGAKDVLGMKQSGLEQQQQVQQQALADIIAAYRSNLGG